MAKIYIIGGANVDIYAKSYNELIIKDSNPSKITFSYGGVARNITHNLANLGLPVSFITCFGCDTFGKDMALQLSQKGVNLDYSIFSKDHNSSIYLAILNKDDMYLGASDMDVLNLLTPEYLNKLNEVINNDDYLIFDTNLSIENINYIANNLKGIKIVDGISANKVIKLKDCLNKLDVLKVNSMELLALSDKDDFNEGINYLLNKGVKKLLVTGKKDLYVGENNKVNHYVHNAYNDNPVNVTGAGDALLAGYVYGLFNKLSEEDSVGISLALAILTVDCKDAVGEYNKEEALNKVKTIGVNKL